MCIYIYIERERYTYIYIYIYNVCMCMCMYIYIVFDICVEALVKCVMKLLFKTCHLNHLLMYCLNCWEGCIVAPHLHLRGLVSADAHL